MATKEFAQGEDGTLAPGQLATLDHLILTLLVVLTSLVYVGTLGFEFVFDDRALIIENPLLRSWRFVPQYFTHHLTSHVFPNVPSSYYRPVLLLWLFINYTLFDLQPWWWHLTTVALHVLVTLSVYFLARRILKDALTAGFAALIFGLHPIHVESVAWVMGLIDPLIALLFISSFLCYLKARDSASAIRRWYTLSLAFYILAMLAKETALALPLIIFVYEIVLARPSSESGEPVSRIRLIRAALRSAAPYLILTLPYLVARAIVLRGLVHTATALPRLTVIFTLPSVLCFYTKLLVWPWRLSAFYDVPYVTSPGITNFVLPALLLAAVAASLAWWAKRSRMAAFSILWLVLLVLPVLNLPVFPEGEIVHDRYLYLPSVGFSFLVALALRRLTVKRVRLWGRPILQMATPIAIFCALGVAAVYQSFPWANNLLLYRHGVTIAPHNPMAKNNLANELFGRGLYADALNLYQQVLDEKPNYWISNYNLGFIHYKLERLEEADRYFRRAIEISPLDADQFVYLGLTRVKMGRLDDAARLIAHAIAMRPQGPGYHFALGTVLKMKGDLPGALREFKAELANDPQQNAARQQIHEIEQTPGNK